MAVGINLLFLFIFKYSGFVAETVGTLMDHSISIPDLALPLGISFYTFQIISYLVDVYRYETPAQSNFFDFALYVSMFPQLVAGPIVRYQDINEQLHYRQHSVLQMSDGIQRFICGLAKKVLIANQFGIIADHAFSLGPYLLTTGMAWFGAISYTFQIYFDFSAYSDMAIGLGKMFGFRFQENFNYPYISKSITEFWRRWHMSLSGWFRDYVYIPLGGSRGTQGENIRNLLLVWLLTGLWHGAAWNFILWGLYYGILLMVERRIGFHKLQLPVILKHGYALFIIIIGWVIFRADSFSQISYYLRALFGLGANTQDTYAALYVHDYWYTAIFAAIGCTPLPRKLFHRFSTRSIFVCTVMQIVVVFSAFAVCVLYLVNATYNPFIYFRF